MASNGVATRMAALDPGRTASRITRDPADLCVRHDNVS